MQSTVFLRPEKRAVVGTLPRREEITAPEYRQLVISNRQLLRADDLARGERGLLDPVAHVRYVIDERRLFAAVETSNLA